MKNLKSLFTSLVHRGSTHAVVGVIAGLTALPAHTLERPKQIVLISFDGSRSVAMWKETRDLANELDIGITVFMSGVHFIPASLLRTNYDPPGPKYGPGTSSIRKIGDDQKATIPERIFQIESAWDEGHIEVGSHAVGHFDAGAGPTGLNWTTLDWISELTQFENILVNIFDINKIPERFAGESVMWKQRMAQSLRGFRAPLLAAVPGQLQPALLKMGYQFDGSEVAPMGKWPYLKQGIWEIPMGVIPIVGTAKKSVSMDYNFYAYDSSARPDLASSHRYNQRFLDSLMNYFNNSYYGNRAPVHVGAHFDDWNGRAYFSGVFEFARKVCSMPEVQCITGKEILEKMKTLGPEMIKRYEAGEFVKLAKPASMPRAEAVDMKVQWDDRKGAVKVSLTGEDVQRLSSKLKYEVLINGKLAGTQLDQISLPTASGIHEVKIRVLRGADELLTSTRRLEIKNAVFQRLEQSDLESNFEKGDLPGAHGGSNDQGLRFAAPLTHI